MIQKRVEDIVQELINRGSEISYSDELESSAVNAIKKDYSLEEILRQLSKRVIDETQTLLDKKNEYGVQFTAGISSCIYLPDFNGNGEYKLKIIGGSRSRSIDLPIDENTLFDVASITKVYTLLLLFTLENEGYINLNDRIADVNPDFSNLKDFTFNDLIRLHGELQTDGIIKYAPTIEEAYEILKTTFLKSDTRETNKYTDLGAIIMGKTIERIMSEKLGREVTFNDIMREYLLDPLGLDNTMFNPPANNSTGNGNLEGLVHDPKSRILGGAVGSAGIFTTSDDLALLARNIYTVNTVNPTMLNKEYISRLGEVTFPTSDFSFKGNLGIYLKHPLGLRKTFHPSEFSTGSFSHEGWIGSIANFDPYNMIHQNILYNAIYEDSDPSKVKNDKPIGFRDASVEYLAQMTKNTLLILVVKEYYNRYLNQKENIDITERVR